MDRKTFNALGEYIVPPAFNMEVAAKTVKARLELATTTASQLRCRYELLGAERSGDGDPAVQGLIRFGLQVVPPLGDEALRCPPEELLDLLAPRLIELPNLEKRLGDKGWREDVGRPGLRSLYGYTPEWETSAPPGSPHRRVPLRIALCLTADATFAPYACGLTRAIAARQATLRTDVLSIAQAIWSWALDYRALAYALSVARIDPTAAVAGFPAFARLVRRVLSERLETSASDLGDEIDAAAVGLAAVATTAIGEIRINGSAYDGSIGKPMVDFLARTNPSWLPDEIEEDAEEVFVRGAAPLVLEALLGRRDADEVVGDLESLTRAMRSARRGGADA